MRTRTAIASEMTGSGMYMDVCIKRRKPQG